MVLSDTKILKEMQKGNILIYPFVKENLATSSYDLTLGEFYYREKMPERYHNKIYNIWNKDHMEHVWGKEWHRAKPIKEVFKSHRYNVEDYKPDDKIILLEPGETILAHTNEFIGGMNCITTMMKARSSLGRSFIEVCKCAGWGDVGYVNRWTMEITNNSKHYTIPLVVGRRIAQMIFFETGQILDRDYTVTGKYNVTTDIKRLKKEWTPTMMLPKLYLDKELAVNKKKEDKKVSNKSKKTKTNTK